MAEVGVAAAAEHFGAYHAERGVRPVSDAAGAHRFEKAWPAAGAGEFGVGAEERVAAGGAVVGAYPFVIPVFAGKRPLGLAETRHGIEFG